MRRRFAPVGPELGFRRTVRAAGTAPQGPFSPATAGTSVVQCAQCDVLNEIVEMQNGHSRVVGSAGGGSDFSLWIALIIMKIATPTMGS